MGKDHQTSSTQRGFTLVELMITVVILAVITVIAVPAYTDYARRGKLTEAVTNLQDLRLRLEQYYQDNRTYIDANNDCAIAMPTLENFNITCNGARRDYTLTALNKTGVGLGDPGDFEYTLNRAGDAVTVTYDGAAANKPCLSVSNRC